MRPDGGGARILVVDDEPSITELLSTALAFEGFSVEVATSGSEALAKADTLRPDLLMLDVMLPDLDGTEVCRRLREAGNGVPVVFLTARDQAQDKVAGLTLGDDYVTKPFGLEELVARVRAVLRRSGGASGLELEEDRLRFADLEMDVGTREVWRRGQLVDLTATEFNLLEFLLENARRVLSKSDILDNVWDYGFNGDPNIVETYISYLRKKVDAVDPPLIHTVRRVGYSLRLPSGPAPGSEGREPGDGS